MPTPSDKSLKKSSPELGTSFGPSIHKEETKAETWEVVKNDEGFYKVRWNTPDQEGRYLWVGHYGDKEKDLVAAEHHKDNLIVKGSLPCEWSAWKDWVPRTHQDVASPPVEEVDHPDHYNAGSIEVIDAIEDWKLGFHEGNVVKYVARAELKGTKLKDLRKAHWYLTRLLEKLDKDEAC